MNHAARQVLWVVSILVVAYAFADVWLAVKTGQLDPSSRQMFAGAVGALIGIIASTKPQPPSGDAPVGPITGANPTIAVSPASSDDPASVIQADTANVVERQRP